MEIRFFYFLKLPCKAYFMTYVYSYNFPISTMWITHIFYINTFYFISSFCFFSQTSKWTLPFSCFHRLFENIKYILKVYILSMLYQLLHSHKGSQHCSCIWEIYKHNKTSLNMLPHFFNKQCGVRFLCNLTVASSSTLWY